MRNDGKITVLVREPIKLLNKCIKPIIFNFIIQYLTTTLVNAIVKLHMSIRLKMLKSATLNIRNLRPWRLNLITSFKDKIYIAVHDQIHVYNSQFELLSMVSVIKANDAGYVGADLGTDEFGATINQIISGYCGKLECIVVVMDDGGCIIYDILSLNKPLYYFNNFSCWGVDIHKNGLLAVSNNNHKIKIWKIANPLNSSNPKTWFSKLQVKYMPFPPTEVQESLLSGHAHNVPCISFSTCGQYVVSASIDKTCRVWLINGPRGIVVKEIGAQWGWITKCIPKTSCKSVNEEKLQEYILQDIQAMTTTTSYPALNRSNPSLSIVEPQINFHTYPRTVSMDGTVHSPTQDGVPFDFYDSSDDDPTVDTDSVHSSPSVHDSEIDRIMAEDFNNTASIDNNTISHNSPSFNDLIIYCSKYDLYVFEFANSDLKTLYSCSNVVRGLRGRRQAALLEHFDRLCLLQSIPEIGVFVVASQQGSGCILQLNRSQNDKYYCKSLNDFHGDTDSPLAGISIMPKLHPEYPSLSYYMIYILYLDGGLKIWRIDLNK